MYCVAAAPLRGARDLGDALHLLPRGALFCDSALRSVLEELRAEGRSALADSVSLALCPDEPAPKRPRVEASDTDSSGVLPTPRSKTRAQLVRVENCTHTAKVRSVPPSCNDGMQAYGVPVEGKNSPRLGATAAPPYNVSVIGDVPLSTHDEPDSAQACSAEPVCTSGWLSAGGGGGGIVVDVP